MDTVSFIIEPIRIQLIDNIKTNDSLWFHILYIQWQILGIVDKVIIKDRI